MLGVTDDPVIATAALAIAAKDLRQKRAPRIRPPRFPSQAVEVAELMNRLEKGEEVRISMDAESQSLVDGLHNEARERQIELVWGRVHDVSYFVTARRAS